MTPEWWLVALGVLSFLGSVVGGYTGATKRIAIMEERLKRVIDWMPDANTQLSQHGEDLLVHDIEIGTLHEKVGIQRVSRQLLRNERRG